MSKVFVMVLLFWLAIPTVAQTDQQSPANPLSTWLHNAYNGNRNNLLRTAEKMPEEYYGLRPGPQEEVRTFGQQVGHLLTITTFGLHRLRAKRIPRPVTILRS